MPEKENIDKVNTHEGQPASEAPSEQTSQSEVPAVPAGQPASSVPPQHIQEEAVNQKIGELGQQLAQVKDQFLRKAAEFENYKRRTENDFALFTKFAGENIITQLLPVLDDFNRSLKSWKETSKGSSGSENDPHYKGVELIYQKFIKILEAQGLKVMDVVGKEFDVNFHDALLQVLRSDVAPHTVVEEVEPGYTLFDKVIRHAKVIVSTADTAPTESKAAEKVKKE
ncbi:MAG: nucleotide exchange factor GrpE [Bacteroidota bacterium]|nr:nucleotide exchange factor GrpE [Bacteroidota bacterium]